MQGPAEVVKLFSISINAPITVIPTNVQHLVACRQKSPEEDPQLETNPIVLLQWDITIYCDSPFYRRNTRHISAADLGPPEVARYIIGADLLQSAAVTIFNESADYFADGYIDNAAEFLRFIKFADKYSLCILRICEIARYTIWLALLQEQVLNLWRANSGLLMPIEQRPFNKPKFPSDGSILVPGGLQPGPYPVRMTPASQILKYSTISDAPSPPFLSTGELSELLDLLSAYKQTEFIARIICIVGSSIEYYHLIFGSPELLDMVSSINSFAAISHYAFRVMYLSELSMYRGKNLNRRFILDLEAAVRLPMISRTSAVGVFAIPYFATMVRFPITDVLTMPAKLVGSRGLYTLPKFLNRMKIYTNNLLRYIVWKTPKASIGLNGSIITACAMRNPLEDSFRDFTDYCDEYYPARSVRTVARNDVRRQHLAVRRLLEEESDDSDGGFNSPRSKSPRRVRTPRSPSSTSPREDFSPIELASSANILDTNGGDMDELVNHKIDYSDIDIMIACDFADFDSEATEVYSAICRAAHKSGSVDVRYAATPSLDRVETENKHKFVIHGLHRDIDIFHVNDIAAVVVRYHLDCVRAWYDGTTLHCFPSFISAAHTGINTDIRWSSNKKDIRDVVMKNYQRGFGTLINETDRQNLRAWLATRPEWSDPAVGGTRPRHSWRRSPRIDTSIYDDRLQHLFNPSVSRIGIHHHLPTRPSFMKTAPTLDYRVEFKRPPKKLTKWDYRQRRETPLLPHRCESISEHL